VKYIDQALEQINEALLKAKKSRKSETVEKEAKG